jgi:hypothetical protein
LSDDIVDEIDEKKKPLEVSRCVDASDPKPIIENLGMIQEHI